MQLASHGGKAFFRQAPQWIPHANARSIHIPRGLPTPSSAGTAQKFVSGARSLLSGFLTHLTAPGLRASSSTHSFARAARTTGQAAIRNGLSLPVRVALSRPLGAPALPRVPALPRSVAQVGLGTARNFHSTRPIFQNLVENVPIAGRAFYEADWDVKMQAEKQNILRTINKDKKRPSKPKALKIAPPQFSYPCIEERVEESASSADDDHYFKDTTPAVVTTLLIPLAPMPTERMPLSLEGIDQGHLLHYPELAHIHSTHSVHALRVSSLFTRLDAANVWEKGVRCSAFSHGSHASPEMGSTCTILKVEFIGWTKAEVRSVIGESGSGWCVLEETGNDEDNESLYSDSLCSHRMEDESITSTLIFPTLDMDQTDILSSPFQTPSSSNTPSLLEFPLDGEEYDMVVPDWGSEDLFANRPSREGYFGFSSSFVERMSNTGWEDADRSQRHNIL